MGYKLKRILVHPGGVEKQVRPSGWKPGANTVAYYPLTTDFTDQSGNGYNLTNSGGVIMTEDGVNCVYFRSGTGAKNTSAHFGTQRTICVWYKGSLNTENSVLGWSGGNISTGTIVLTLTSGNKPNISNFYNYGTSSNTTYSTNAWHCACCSVNGSTWKLVVDGVEISLSGQNVTSSTGIAIGYRYDGTYDSRFVGYLSNMIFESVARTAQEMIDYYNLTKRNYGL